jgi:hypothetical protein
MDSFLQFLLESAVCLAVFYAAYWIFLKNETYFALNRVYLVSALLVSLAIPLIKLTSPFVTREVAPLSLGALSGAPPASPRLSLSLLLAAIYGIGVLALSARFIFQLVQIIRTIRSCPKQECRDCRYVFTEKEIQPFSFFNYIFLNTDSIPLEHLPRILDHERVHIKQYHSMDILIMELVTILQWFNPFVWPYKKSLKETHEYLADNAVIAQGCSAPGYQLLILEQHVGGKLVELAHNFHQSQIKRRITMITKIKSRRAAKLKLLFVLPLAAFLVLVLAEPKVVAKTADLTPQWQEDTGRQPADATVPQDKQKQKQEEQKMKEEKDKKALEVKKEYQIIQAKIEQLETELKKADANGDKKEIKASLVELYNKEKKIEAWLNGEGGDAKKVEYASVSAEEIRNKIEKVKQKIEETDDPNQKKELEVLLKKLTVELKSIQEGKKDVYTTKGQKKGKKEKK